MKQKKIFFLKKKNSKWPIFQNGRFSKSRKFHRLVLGLIKLIVAKGINVTQHMAFRLVNDRNSVSAPNFGRKYQYRYRCRNFFSRNRNFFFSIFFNFFQIFKNFQFFQFFKNFQFFQTFFLDKIFDFVKKKKSLSVFKN